jgi:hypothetical protein
MTPRVTDEERAKFEEWNRAAAIPATDADDCVKPMGLVNIIMRERARAWQAARAELAEVRAAAAGMAVLWTCPDCAFGFDAAHTEEPGGGYSCPACAEDRLRAELERHRLVCHVDAALLESALACAVEMRKWGVSFDDPRLDYIEVQVDRESVRAFDETLATLGTR